MTTFLWVLCDDLTAFVPFAVLCFFPLKEYFRFPVKKTVRLTALVIIASNAADAGTQTYIYSVIDNPDKLYSVTNITFLAPVIVCFVWYIYAIKTIWQRKAFIFLFTLVVAMFTTSIANYIIQFLPDNEVHSVTYSNSQTVILSFIIDAVCVPLMYLFSKKLYMPVDKFIGKKEYLYMDIPMLILFVIYYFMFTFISFKTLSTDPSMTMLYFGLLIMVFILYAIIFRMCRLFGERQAANERYIQTQFQIDIRDEQYRRISDNIENVRRQRHDLRIHMTALYGFLTNGETNKAIEYLDQYLETTQTQKLVRYSTNHVVNVLVSHYADIAKKRETAFYVHIQIPDDLPIQDTDISVVIGNLLENAIDAVCELPPSERSIKVNMIYRGNMLAITVDNTFNGVVNQKDGVYLSTKSEHRGMGLSSIADIAGKYGSVEFRNDDKMFYSAVMLKADD